MGVLIHRDGEPVKVKAAELYDLCRAGDDEAWQVLYSYCLRKARAKLLHEAEDIAQAVCLRLLDGAIETIKDPRAFLGFVATAVRNEAIDRMRKNGRLVPLEPPKDKDDESQRSEERRPSPNPLPDAQAGARLMLQKLLSLVSSLPSYCEDIMAQYLRYQLGLIKDYKAMAELMGIPLSTLSVRIKRCVDRLREMPEFRELLAREEG